MEEYLNSWKKCIEKFIIDEPENNDIEVSQLEINIDRIIKWVYRNVVPVLALSLIINLSILFSTSVEVAMSRWFWLKDPLSIILAFGLVRAINWMMAFQARND